MLMITTFSIKTKAMWYCGGYHYCTTSFNKDWNLAHSVSEVTDGQDHSDYGPHTMNWLSIGFLKYSLSVKIKIWENANILEWEQNDCSC